MQVIGHKQIVAYQPRGRGMLPNAVQRALDRSLCKPTSAALGANGQENPVWPAEGNVDSFRGRVTAWFMKGKICHVQIRNGRLSYVKEISSRAKRARRIMGQSGSSALPIEGRAVLPRRPISRW